MADTDFRRSDSPQIPAYWRLRSTSLAYSRRLFGNRPSIMVPAPLPSRSRLPFTYTLSTHTYTSSNSSRRRVCRVASSPFYLFFSRGTVAADCGTLSPINLHKSGSKTPSDSPRGYNYGTSWPPILSRATPSCSDSFIRSSPPCASKRGNGDPCGWLHPSLYGPEEDRYPLMSRVYDLGLPLPERTRIVSTSASKERAPASSAGASETHRPATILGNAALLLYRTDPLFGSPALVMVKLNR